MLKSKILLLLSLLLASQVEANTKVHSNYDERDILLVVDDGSGMAQYQQKLADNLSSLLRDYHKSDLQIAVSTTSAAVETAPKIVGQVAASSGKAAIQAAAEIIRRVGEAGLSEPPIFRSILATVNDQTFRNFRRPNVPLILIVVSNSGDYSQPLSFEEFSVHLNQGEPLLAEVHSITSVLGCRNTSGDRVALQRMVSFVHHFFNMAAFSICDTDWSGFKTFVTPIEF